MINARSVLRFNKTLGASFPKKFCEKLGLHWKDLVVVFMVDDKTIGIKKMEVKE